MACACAAYLRRLLLELHERSRGVSGVELRRVDKHLSRCGNHPALAVRDSRMIAVELGKILAQIEHPESFLTDVDDDKTPVRTLVFNDDTQPNATLPEPPPRPRGKR